MADPHDLTRSESKGSHKCLKDLTWRSNIGWSCGTLLNLWPRHNTSLWLEVFGLTVWAECLLLSFPSPRPPLECGVTSLTLGSLSSPGMLVPPSQIVPSQITVRGTPLPHCSDRYLHSSNVPFWAESSFPVPSWSSVLYVIVPQLVVQQLSCSCAVGQPTSQLTVNWLLLVSQERTALFIWLLVRWSNAGC